MAQSCCSFKISLIFFFNRGAQCNSVKTGVTLWICICLMWVKILAAAFCISGASVEIFFFFFPFQKGYKIVYCVCLGSKGKNDHTNAWELHTLLHNPCSFQIGFPPSTYRVRDARAHHRPEGLQCSLLGYCYSPFNSIMLSQVVVLRGGWNAVNWLLFFFKDFVVFFPPWLHNPWVLGVDCPASPEHLPVLEHGLLKCHGPLELRTWPRGRDVDIK